MITLGTQLFKSVIVTLLLCHVFVCYCQQDKWIDKNENENYIARHECSFVQAGDKFIMFGGREKAQQLDVYDFTTDTWSKGGNAPKEFNHFQATFYEGFVWVIGSFKTNNFPKEVPADYIWLYFPPTKAWIQGPKIPKDRRRGGSGLVLYNDKFYVIGGNTIGHDGGFVNWFDVYDPKANTWTILEDAPNARDHFSGVVANTKLYALGGRHSGGESGVFKPLIAPVDVYDFKNETWSSLKKILPTPRAAPGVALFHNEILVMGGEGEQKGPAYKLVEAYNLKTNSWSRKADMHYPRHGTQAIVCGEGVYIAGGSPVRGGGRQHNMEVYNEDTPKGTAILTSKLKGPKKKCIPVSKVTKIKLKTLGGNSGCFINSISIEGDNSDAFMLLSDLNLTLIKSDDSAVVEVKHQGQHKKEKAKVAITYNNDSKIEIDLVSK